MINNIQEHLHHRTLVSYCINHGKRAVFASKSWIFKAQSSIILRIAVFIFKRIPDRLSVNHSNRMGSLYSVMLSMGVFCSSVVERLLF